MATQKPSSGFSLKDHLFNRERIEYLAGRFADVDANFDTASFVKATLKGFAELELKQRIVKIAVTLDDYLDPNFTRAAKQIVAALPPPLDPTLKDDDFGDFIFAPLGEFVVRRGCDARHLNCSLRTLKQLTMRFSMEDAIRRFINQFPDQTLAELGSWATDKNYHVRRLVSEGTRPRLPWSGRLSIPVTAPLHLLDILHSDPTRYVTRSVANHLNDIAKSESHLVIDTLRRWRGLSKQTEAELQWITRHALRTLVKQGHAGAMKLLGLRTKPAIEVSEFSISTPRTRPGGALEFRFTVTAQRREQLVIDYVIDFVKSKGNHTSKVFKLKPVTLAENQRQEFKKRHPFPLTATTFTLYPGTHWLTLQINGQACGRLSFEME